MSAVVAAVPSNVPTDEPNAVIPDERVQGPLLLVCGGLDDVWLSCPYARAIKSRLEGFHHPYRDHLYVYARAGHFVGALLPYTPVAPGRLYFKAVDERARENLWPHLLSFLSQLK